MTLGFPRGVGTRHSTAGCELWAGAPSQGGVRPFPELSLPTVRRGRVGCSVLAAQRVSTWGRNRAFSGSGAHGSHSDQDDLGAWQGRDSRGGRRPRLAWEPATCQRSSAFYLRSQRPAGQPWQRWQRLCPCVELACEPRCRAVCQSAPTL